MSGMKGILKEGWHPKGKEGGKESWRGDFKGINQVAGWMGKGKDGSDSGATERVSRPISSLKDPASFGPPPRRANTGGIAPAPPARQYSGTQSVELPEHSRPAPPPVPYRSDTTGLSTSHLPPPPARRNDTSNEDSYNSGPVPKPKPSLPPRLPARNIPNRSPSPPPAYELAADPPTRLNQGAMNRLGKAGVSVPSLGIGGGVDSNAENNKRFPPTNELKSHFAKFNTSSDSSQQAGSPIDKINGQHIKYAASAAQTAANHQQQHQYQPQSTLQRTLSSETSTTANRPPPPAPRTSTSSSNLRENEHVQAGMRKLSGLNQKYGITKRIHSFIEDQKSPADSNSPQQQSHQQQSQTPPPPPPQRPNQYQREQYSPPPSAPGHPYSQPNTSRPDLDTLNRRKPPPPPPPPKKREMQSAPIQTGHHSPSPPPLPLNTKPTF